MTKKCYVCKVEANAQNNSSFHKFPSNDIMKQQWISALGLPKTPNVKTAFICGSHFEEKDFFPNTESRKRPRLLPSAIPSCGLTSHPQGCPGYPQTLAPKEPKQKSLIILHPILLVKKDIPCSFEECKQDVFDESKSDISIEENKPNISSQESESNLCTEDSKLNISSQESGPNFVSQESGPNFSSQETEPNLSIEDRKPDISIQESKSNVSVISKSLPIDYIVPDPLTNVNIKEESAIDNTDEDITHHSENSNIEESSDCKRYIKHNEVLPIKQIRLTDGVQTELFYRQDFASEETWDRFVRIIEAIRNRQAIARQKRARKRRKWLQAYRKTEAFINNEFGK